MKYEVKNLFDKTQGVYIQGYYFRSKWHSIKWINGQPYKHRVETIILNGNDSMYASFNSDNFYKLPGGHIERGVSKLQQAVNECREEARINVTKMKYVGSYIDQVIDRDSFYHQVQVVGQFVEVFIGNYDSHYRGVVFSHEEDHRLYDNGKFHKIDDIFDKLSESHRHFIKLLIS